MIERGLSQADIRAMLRVSSGVIARWLHGERRPSVDQIVQIEKQFGIPAAAWTEVPAEPFTVPDVLPASPPVDVGDLDDDDIPDLISRLTA